MTYNTKIVNFFGGAGVRKTTHAAGAYNRFKEAGIIVDYAPEYARDLIIEGQHEKLRCQPHVFGEQLWRIVRGFGQFQVVITDSPLLMSLFYVARDYPARDSFKRFVAEMFNSHKDRNINLFVQRQADSPHSMVGRIHDLQDSIMMDNLQYRYLHENDIPFELVDGAPTSLSSCLTRILAQL